MNCDWHQARAKAGNVNHLFPAITLNDCMIEYISYLLTIFESLLVPFWLSIVLQ